METLEAIEKRHSVRSYEARPVEREKLDEVLRAADSAPIAGEMSMVLITCPNMLGPMNDAAKQAMLASGNDFLIGRASLEGYEPMYGCAACILICAPEGGYSQMNCGAAAEAACVAATDLGLGSCFTVSPCLAFKPEFDMMQWLEVPEGHVPQVCVLLGYQAGEAFGTPGPSRRGLENVSYILATESCEI